MGLLFRLTQRLDATGRPTDGTAPGADIPERAQLVNPTWAQIPALEMGAEQQVAGESHYQANLRAGVPKDAEGREVRLVTALLVREPDNSYDAGAVAVYLTGRKIGHLPRADTTRFHVVLDDLAAAGRPATARARITGADHLHYGIILDAKPKLSTPDAPVLPRGTWQDITIDPAAQDDIRKILGAAKTRTVVIRFELAADGAAAIVLHKGQELRAGRLVSDALATLQVADAHHLPLVASGRIERLNREIGLRAAVAPPQLYTEAPLTSEQREEREMLAKARQQSATGRWQCHRCGTTWRSKNSVPSDWATRKNGPHVCPDCGSYTYTAPIRR